MICRYCNYSYITYPICPRCNNNIYHFIPKPPQTANKTHLPIRIMQYISRQTIFVENIECYIKIGVLF